MDHDALTGEESDETLAARVAGRDVAAFGLLFDRYAQTIYVFAAHLLGTADADEAVGSFFSPATNNWEQPLVEHWNGAAWSVVPSPSIGTSSVLRGVAALAPNDIWAVGDTYTTQYQTLVLHWDGARWSLVASAQPNTSDNRRNGVTTLADGTAWVVGWQAQSAPPYQTTLVERYVCQ